MANETTPDRYTLGLTDQPTVYDGEYADGSPFPWPARSDSAVHGLSHRRADRHRWPPRRAGLDPGASLPPIHGYDHRLTWNPRHEGRRALGPTQATDSTNTAKRHPSRTRARNSGVPTVRAIPMCPSCSPSSASPKSYYRATNNLPRTDLRLHLRFALRGAANPRKGFSSTRFVADPP